VESILNSFTQPIIVLTQLGSVIIIVFDTTERGVLWIAVKVKVQVQKATIQLPV